jgi:predicted nucleic acid-binding protein
VANVVLVDTNVLVYAHDSADPDKQARAIDVLEALHDAGCGVLSAYSLAEFFWTCTRGRRPLLPVLDAQAQVERFALGWPVYDVSAAIVLEALSGVRRHRLPYWDAQLWATARLNQIPIVLSEDFSDGSRLGGGRFLNPFTPEFDLRALLRPRR